MWTFLLPGFLARQPFAMLTIGIVLLVEHTTGSFGAAGAVSAATGVAMALFAPRSGRLADRFGQPAVLVPGVLLHAASVTLLIVLALSGAPLWALLLTAVPTGASVPQVGPMVRARWAYRLGDPSADGPVSRPGSGGSLLPTAAALESVTDELTFVIGPVLATALCTGVHPAAGLVAEVLLTITGGLLFAAQRRTAPPAHRGVRTDGGRDGTALSVPGVRVLAVAFLGVGAVFGGMQVSLAAFTEQIGRPDINGLLYGIFAAGNMLAGVVWGAVAWRAAPQRRLLTAYGLLTLATAPLWAVETVPLLAALGLLAGLGVAPVLITGFTLVERLAPAGVRTEAFTWLAGSVALGQAVAATAAGQLADGFGAGAGFTVPLVATALALVTVTALRRPLAPEAGRPPAAGARSRARGGSWRVVRVTVRWSRWTKQPECCTMEHR